MAFSAALPKFKTLQKGEMAATFVVPAPRGCNLTCPFCIIRARREAKPLEHALTAEDYTQFLHALCAQHRVGLVSLQGYEPLLPESWPYSAALLETARSLGIDTALITNGTHLAERVSDLVRLEVKGITVSIDSGDPALHDASRGTTGAFAQALHGLRVASASPLRERVMVASVLQCKKSHYLRGMPTLLKDLGIKQWVVTPVYKVGHSTVGGIADSHESIVLQLRWLNSLSGQNGIQMLVDDEFSELAEGTTGKLMRREALRLRQLERLESVVRLSPNGSCSVGRDILRRADGGVPRWRAKDEEASDFVARVLGSRVRAKLQNKVPLSRADTRLVASFDRSGSK